MDMYHIYTSLLLLIWLFLVRIIPLNNSSVIFITPFFIYFIPRIRTRIKFKTFFCSSNIIYYLKIIVLFILLILYNTFSQKSRVYHQYYKLNRIHLLVICYCHQHLNPVVHFFRTFLVI